MRDISDKFVGGIGRIDAHSPASRRGLSLRAVLLGLAGVALISVAEPYNQNVYENTMLIGNQLPIAVLFLMLMLVLVVNPILARLPRVEPLAASELVVVMTMMLAACAVIWSGFHRLWAHQLIAPFYHLKGHERWGPSIESLPAWLVPSADPENVEVIYNFYAGQSAVPWWPWCWTALKWAPFVLALFVGLFFLMALFRRQWEEAEKLSFPLAAIALETLRPPPPGRLLNDMFRSKLFWWTVGIVVVLQTLYGLHVYFPQIPAIVFKYDLHAALETPPWRHLPHWIRAKDAFFVVVGVSFFLSTEMSFSLWAFVILLGLVEMVGKNFQYPIHEHFDDHQIGAYIAYAAVIVWVARRHLARAFRSIGRRPRSLDGDDQIAERSAAIGFLVCFVIAWAWLTLAGLPAHVACLVALVVFMLSLVVGRVVAESGMLFVQYNCWPHLFAESTFPQLLTPRTHTLIHFTTIAPTMDAREGLMPYAFNAARMADGVEHLGPRRRLFGLWILCLVLALVLAGAAQLSIVYDRGANLADDWAGRQLPERTYNSSAEFADLLQRSPDRIRSVWSQHAWRVAAGGSAVLGLCFLRYRFLAWPLHPIGFIMANTYPIQVCWLSIMIGWLCKTLVMRLGGVPVYRKLCPAFLGMIVATTFSSVFWILVKIAGHSTGEAKVILFLPS